ncbi:MAG: glycosyltransferase [Bifidobacteriaceae bacterium]|jgi:1,2-diacylglycerol 3-alpha-glucosyltransferase|nr:glycosyltransferase [Bifidobacteriaceae bacterium]
MKILLATDFYVPVINGVVMSVLNLKRGLESRGHEVRILTLSQTMRSFDEGGVTYVGSAGFGLLYPEARVRMMYGRNIVRALAQWRPDIVHTQCEFSTFPIARRIAELLDVPIIHTYHTVYESYTHYFSPSKKLGRIIAKAVSRRVIDQASCVIAPTEKVRAVLNGYGITQTIHVLPTGIDMSRFAAEPPAARLWALRHRLGIPDGDRVLLYVGRLAKEKNVQELLRYHAKYRPTGVTLLIVGDGPFRPALERMVTDLLIEDSVAFAGEVAQEDVPDYYHLGDLFVSASVSEAQGLTYAEAVAAGLPVLCRMDPGLEGLIPEGSSGWFYRDEADYLVKLQFFLSTGDTELSLVTDQADDARLALSYQSFAAGAERIYLDLLGASR